MVDFVPVLQGFVTAAGVIIAAVLAAILARRSYVKQKETDREEDLRKRRAEGYENYIKASRAVIWHATRLHQQGGDSPETEWFLGEARAKYDEGYNYLLVIGSDDVSLCATALHARLSEHYAREVIDTDELRADEDIRDLYTDLIAAMRRDCFEETRLSKDQFNPGLNW